MRRWWMIPLGTFAMLVGGLVAAHLNSGGDALGQASDATRTEHAGSTPAAAGREEAPERPDLSGSVVLPKPRIGADATEASGPTSAPAAPAVRALKDGSGSLVWTSTMIAREEALERASASLLRQSEELAIREKKVSALFEEAQVMRQRCESACGVPVVSFGDVFRVVPLTAAEREERMQHVLQIIKKMKPRAAAERVSEWDEGMAVAIFQRLSPRVVSPIMEHLDPVISSQILAHLATGHAVRKLRQGR